MFTRKKILSVLFLSILSIILLCINVDNPITNIDTLRVNIEIPNKHGNLLWEKNDIVPIKIIVGKALLASALRIEYGDDSTKFDSIPIRSNSILDTFFTFNHSYDDTGIKHIQATVYSKNGKPPVSNQAATDIGQAPMIVPKIIQTSNSKALIDSPFVLFVDAQGYKNLTYHWIHNGVEDPNKNSNLFQIPTLSNSDSGTYSCIVSNLWGQDMSDPYILIPVPLIVSPIITVQPTDRQVTVGNSAIFYLSANGSSLQYQWAKNGIDIVNAKKSLYETGLCALGDNNAMFTCKVFNTADTIVSRGAKLTVFSEAQPPVVIDGPKDVTIFAGERANFSIVAQGTNLKYQWLMNNVVIPHAIVDNFQTELVTLGENGSTFRCIVFNSVGSDTSNSATLTVNPVQIPIITKQPQDAVVTLGVSAVFSLTAAGTNLTYRWQKNQIDIPGASSSSYTAPPSVKADNGSKYRCIVENIAGSVTSMEVNLKVTEEVVKPDITLQPHDQNVLVNSNAAFLINATGTSLSYQWQRDGIDISGAIFNIYTIVGTKLSDNGAKFRCIVSNSVGIVTSTEAILTVHNNIVPPKISVGPQSIHVTQGEPATFLITAEGINLTYQWYKNGVAITGANLATFTHSNAQLADNGVKFTCIVSNSAGSVTSNEAILTVSIDIIPPTITSQPQDCEVKEGGNASFHIVAAGTSLNYQWKKNGNDINGEIKPYYVLYNVQISDNNAVFSCNVSNSSGSVMSKEASLKVNAVIKKPVITVQPHHQQVTEGSNATFTITATGVDLVYQWKKNSIPISGATSSLYTLIGVTMNDNGANFTCLISNSAGSVTSNNVTLTVTALVQPPVITKQPVSITAKKGESATFTMSAVGTDLQYQWKRNGSAITGATNSSYTLKNIETSDNDSKFKCVVSNSAGSVTSNEVTLTVTAIPAVITNQPKSQTVRLGRHATFSITATGTNLVYQWYRNGSKISGATSATYQTLKTKKSNDCDRFKCIVSNDGGDIESQEVYLYVHWAPVIRNNPRPETVNEGGIARFTVEMWDEGNPRMSYQWYCYNSENPGANSKQVVISSGRGNPVLHFRAYKQDNNKRYFCRIWNTSFPAIASNTARLTVYYLGRPNIRGNQKVKEGEHVSFTVQVDANPSPSYYQWFKNGSSMGSNSSSLSFTAHSDDNNARIKCKVTNLCGTKQSGEAILKVTTD